MNRPSVALLFLVIALTGCGEPARVEVPASHPAHPDATAATMPSRSTTLATPAGGVDTTTPASPASSGHEHHHHGGMSGEGHGDVVATGNPKAVTDPTQTGDRYTCPMHPEIVVPNPGKCPTCGMELYKKDVVAKPDIDHDHPPTAHPDQATPAPAQTEAKFIPKPLVADRYTCSMHPEVIQSEPGKCPKCGMKLKKMEGEHP